MHQHKIGSGLSLLRHVPPASRDSHDTPSAISTFWPGTQVRRSRGKAAPDETVAPRHGPAVRRRRAGGGRATGPRPLRRNSAPRAAVRPGTHRRPPADRGAGRRNDGLIARRTDRSGREVVRTQTRQHRRTRDARRQRRSRPVLEDVGPRRRTAHEGRRRAARVAGRPGERVPRSQHGPDRRPGRVVGRVSGRRGQGGRTGHRSRPDPSRSGRPGDGGQDFSGSSGTGDMFGHGTHVASVVGGGGVASGSGGSRRGVAPGARPLVGKVLGDDGFGSSSQVIAGMEWAAEQGADVVIMSLGSSGASDGTDPMSLALNDLSRRSGALFVVAAGNNGGQGLADDRPHDGTGQGQHPPRGSHRALRALLGGRGTARHRRHGPAVR